MTAIYNREDLLTICEQAFVPQDEWRNRDTAFAQRQLGQCYALLRAGCDYVIQPDTDDQTIWVELVWKGFGYFDYGGNLDDETFYLPTVSRLEARKGRDWY